MTANVKNRPPARPRVLGGSTKLLGAAEAAERIHVPVSRLYRRWQEWGMPGFHVGRSLVFYERELDAWVQQLHDAEVAP